MMEVGITRAPARLEFVVAGDTRQAIEDACGKSVWRSLADNGFVERTSVTCVGFHRDLEGNSLLVVLPKAFSERGARERLANPAYRREQVFRLIRVFKKIRRETEFSLTSGETNLALDREVCSTDPVLDSFDAALSLRRDYCENGLYIRRANRHAVGNPSLPVNWPRTILDSQTVICRREVFFSSTVNQTRKRDFAHPLCLLHIACLKEIFALTGERSDLQGAEALDAEAYRRVRARPRGYLRDLRASTFDERGRFLISAISAFLGEAKLVLASRKVQEQLLSYTRDFEDIWERVLRDLMAPGLSRRTLPAGKWFGWPYDGANNGMQPEFDIRLESGEANVLVDAKDYRLLNGSKWQGSNGDHYKQIIYRQLLVKPGDSRVFNILAFPSLNQGTLFAVRGCHHWDQIQGSRVFEVTVDYDLAVKRWLRETSLDIDGELSELLKILSEFNRRLDAAPQENTGSDSGGDARGLPILT